LSYILIYKTIQEDKKEIKKQLDEMASRLEYSLEEIQRNTNFLSEMEHLKQNLKNLQNKIEERQKRDK
jgi:hypothetical protein